MNKFILLFLLRARVLNSVRMQVLLNESWSAPPFVKKDKSCVGGLTGGDCGTAGAVGQSVVSNCESEFKESSTLSCRGSTLVVENNQTQS